MQSLSTPIPNLSERGVGISTETHEPVCRTPHRDEAGVGLDRELHGYSQAQLSAFLITCATQVNAAAKRNDMEAVHALIHAEASALIEIHSRDDYFGWRGSLDRAFLQRGRG